MTKPRKDVEGKFAAFEPTTEERVIVALLAGEGTPYRAICRFIRRADKPQPGKMDPPLEPISLRTLQRHFKHELKEGREIADAEIVSANYKLMRAGNPQVTMFLAKARLGWKEVTEVHMRESYGDLVKQSHEKAEERRKLALIQGGKAGDESEGKPSSVIGPVMAA